MERECPLPHSLHSRLGGLGERFWGVKGAILCDFHASFSAFNSCLEVEDSYIPLLV